VIVTINVAVLLAIIVVVRLRRRTQARSRADLLQGRNQQVGLPPHRRVSSPIPKEQM
jgi:hypothetical protein